MADLGGQVHTLGILAGQAHNWRKSLKWGAKMANDSLRRKSGPSACGAGGTVRDSEERCGSIWEMPAHKCCCLEERPGSLLGALGSQAPERLSWSFEGLTGRSPHDFFHLLSKQVGQNCLKVEESSASPARGEKIVSLHCSPRNGTIQLKQIRPR